MSVINYFVPNRQIISSITQSNPAVITTTQNHGYNQGLYVRLYIPEIDGMQPLNQGNYLITVLSPNTFSIPVDTTNFDAFSNSSEQSAQVIPTAEIAQTLINAVENNNNIPPENTWITTSGQ